MLVNCCVSGFSVRSSSSYDRLIYQTRYDILKENILRYKVLNDSPVCHLVASFGAGTVVTTISQPADVVRIRLMADHGPNKVGAGFSTWLFTLIWCTRE